MHFFSDGYTCLEVLPFAQVTEACLTLSGGGEVLQRNAFCHRELFPLRTGTEYTLSAKGCELGFTYLSQGAQLCEEGIKVLTPHSTPTPFRESTHFTPPCGWLNDPNGLCFHGGWYHMYYQFYPHSQRWGNMHWGHAVSRDLVHWVHQRVFLTPQQVLLERTDRMGGAFSGSAVTEGDGLRFYLTRHIAPRDDESAMEEIQVTTYSPDGVEAEKEIAVITRDTPHFSHHFRDPKVLEVDGEKCLILGSCIDGVPAILGYRSKDGQNWRYTGPVLRVPVPGCESIECPDLFPLGDTWVAVAALMNLTDGDGRKNPLHWYAGDLRYGALEAQSQGLFDFGGSFYAVQTFAAGERRIAVGWVADFYGEHIHSLGGVCGSMSYPRELTWKAGRLYMRPVREVYELLGPRLPCTPESKVHVSVPGNAYYARIDLSGDADFTAVLAQTGTDDLRLERRGGVVRLRSTRIPGADLRASCGPVRTVEVFFDHRTAEVFLNEGETAGTKTFYCPSDEGAFSFSTNAPTLIRALEVRTL